MAFLIGNWKMVLILLLVASNALFVKLWTNEIHKFETFKAQVEEAGRAAEKDKVRIESEHMQTVKEIGDAWAKNMEVARDNAVRNYLDRVSNNSGGGAMPGLTIRPETVHGTGSQQVATCEPDALFIRDAAEDAARIAEWQEWAERLKLPIANTP